MNQTTAFHGAILLSGSQGSLVDSIVRSDNDGSPSISEVDGAVVGETFRRNFYSSAGPKRKITSQGGFRSGNMWYPSLPVYEIKRLQFNKTGICPAISSSSVSEAESFSKRITLGVTAGQRIGRKIVNLGMKINVIIECAQNSVKNSTLNSAQVAFHLGVDKLGEISVSDYSSRIYYPTTDWYGFRDVDWEDRYEIIADEDVRVCTQPSRASDVAEAAPSAQWPRSNFQNFTQFIVKFKPFVTEYDTAGNVVLGDVFAGVTTFMNEITSNLSTQSVTWKYSVVLYYADF